MAKSLGKRDLVSVKALAARRQQRQRGGYEGWDVDHFVTTTKAPLPRTGKPDITSRGTRSA